MAESDSTSESSMASESGSHALVRVLCQRCQTAVHPDWPERKNSSIHQFLGSIARQGLPASPLAVSRFAAA